MSRMTRAKGPISVPRVGTRWSEIDWEIRGSRRGDDGAAADELCRSAKSVSDSVAALMGSIAAARSRTGSDAERTYITPSDSAGVAISSSPIEFVAMCLNDRAGGDDEHLAVLVRQIDLAVGGHRRRAEAAADLRQPLPVDLLAGLQVVGVEHAVVRRARRAGRRRRAASACTSRGRSGSRRPLRCSSRRRAASDRRARRAGRRRSAARARGRWRRRTGRRRRSASAP